MAHWSLSRELVHEGVVRKIGEARGARYHLLGPHEETPTPSHYEGTLTLCGLEEDRVFAETNIVLALSSKLQQNAFSIIRYAFTEVLNNAIEHWQSETSALLRDTFRVHWGVLDSLPRDCPSVP